MEEKKVVGDDAKTGVKIVGGHKTPEAGDGVKILGSKQPDEITTMDQRPEPESKQ